MGSACLNRGGKPTEGEESPFEVAQAYATYGLIAIDRIDALNETEQGEESRALLLSPEVGKRPARSRNIPNEFQEMLKRSFDLIMVALLTLTCSGASDQTASNEPNALAVMKWREDLAFLSEADAEKARQPVPHNDA